MGQVTITVTDAHAFSKGDLVMLDDPRGAWRKVLDWLCWFFNDDPIPTFIYRITDVQSAAFEIEDDPGYRYHRPQDTR
jgi:hypothetical protein